jgi:hypothetical protein
MRAMSGLGSARWAVGAAIAGAATVVIGASPAAAACPAGSPLTVGAVESGQAAGAAALPVTGAAIELLLIGAIALVATGCILVALSWRTGSLRPAHLAVAAAVLVATVVGAGAPASALAAGQRPVLACPSTLLPSTAPILTGSATQGAIGAPPVLPESPLAVLLPVGAVGVGAVMLRRRYRTAQSSAEGPG